MRQQKHIRNKLCFFFLGEMEDSVLKCPCKSTLHHLTNAKCV